MTTKFSDIKRATHEIDAKGQVLGRLSTQVATLLVGKNKPYFTRHLDCGDFVTILNAKDIKVTGNKETTKTYTRYSGYPGGIKRTNLKMLRATKPNEIIHHAVWGMLPNNKLRDIWITRLKFK